MEIHQPAAETAAEHANGHRPARHLRSQATAFLAVWLLSLAALFLGAAPLIRRYTYGPLFTAAVLAAFGLQLGWYWLPGFPALRARFEIPGLRRRALLIGAALLIPYVVYALGIVSALGRHVVLAPWLLTGAAKLAGLTAVVLGVYALFPPRAGARAAPPALPTETGLKSAAADEEERFRALAEKAANAGEAARAPALATRHLSLVTSLTWQDIVVMLVVATPVYVGFYRNIFPLPVYLDVMARLFVVALAAFAILSLRELPGTGFRWRLSVGDWLEGGKQLILCSLIALPLGFAMRFIAWHPRDEGLPAFAFSFLGIFLFIAVAEELFFRGILQNLLEKTLSNKYAARGIAAGIFGLSHIHHHFPNWRYVIMAAIAGWFYGTAWHNRRSIMASCVTHAAVDALWRHFFTV